MRTKKRLTKLSKRELKRDRFVDTTFDWALWVRENVRKVAVLGGALALLMLGIVLYRSTQASASRQAGQNFEEVRQAYIAGNYQLAANDFKQFLVRYPDSEYADDAALYLGDSYLRAGDYPSAIKALEEFEGEHGDSPLAYAATNLLGAAYEASGNQVKAAEIYGRAHGQAQHDYQRIASLMDRARVYAAQQEKDKAADAYREIIEKYPESSLAREAKVRLAELSAEPLGVVAQTQSADEEPGAAVRDSA